MASLHVLPSFLLFAEIWYLLIARALRVLTRELRPAKNMQGTENGNSGSLSTKERGKFAIHPFRLRDPNIARLCSYEDPQ